MYRRFLSNATPQITQIPQNLWDLCNLCNLCNLRTLLRPQRGQRILTSGSDRRDCTSPERHAGHR